MKKNLINYLWYLVIFNCNCVVLANGYFFIEKKKMKVCFFILFWYLSKEINMRDLETPSRKISTICPAIETRLIEVNLLIFLEQKIETMNIYIRIYRFNFNIFVWSKVFIFIFNGIFEAPNNNLHSIVFILCIFRNIYWNWIFRFKVFLLKHFFLKCVAQN